MSSTASAAAAQPKPLVNRFPRCFFEITIEGLYAGIIVFELYDELCPKTVENFRVLCTGEKGVGPTGKSLCYKGTEIHRVVPHFIIQGGDVLRQGGKGTYSIYDRYFDDENFSLNHACMKYPSYFFDDGVIIRDYSSVVHDSYDCLTLYVTNIYDHLIVSMVL